MNRSEIEQRVRAGGAVLDMPMTQEIYAPLLQEQRRDGVAVTRDVAYGTHARHRLDIYQPERGDGAALPVLLFLHGGGFIRGDKSEKENFGQYFARNGYVIALANYRRAPQSMWPAGAQDVSSALAWLHGNIAEYGGDPQRIFLMGESAGAAHVAAAALVRRFHPPGGLAISGVVLISGVYDVELERRARRQFGVPTPDPRTDSYFGPTGERDAEMSTVRLIDAAPMPVLITYAELDLLQMQVQASELFAALVVQHRFEPDLQVIRGHNHLSQVYAVNTGDESLSGPVTEFLKRYR